MSIKDFIKIKSEKVEHNKIRAIFNNAGSLKKYVLNNNKKISKENYTEGQLYALYVVRYYNYLRMHGYKFNKEQIAIVNRCKQIKDEVFYDPTYEFYELPETMKENRKLRKIVIDLVSDEEKLKAFLSNGKDYNGITYEEICEYVTKEHSLCKYLSDNIEINNDNVTRNIQLLNLYCNERGYSHNQNKEPQFEVDPKLKTKVLSGVSKKLLNKENRTNEEQVELAYQIFCSLNRALSYDEKMHIEDQHQLDFDSYATGQVHKVYYKNPGEITLKNNSVACRSWSYLYSKLLNDVNIKSFVAHSHVHKKVMFLDNDGGIYLADGTQAQNEISYGVGIDVYRMTDMERAKIGLRTTNFTKVSINEQNQKVTEIYKDGKFEKPKICPGKLEGVYKGVKARIKKPFSPKENDEFKKFFIRALKNEPIKNDEYTNVRKMLRLIEEVGKMPEIFEKPFREGTFDRKKTFEVKLKLISRILLTLEPHMCGDNTVIRALTSNLKHWLLESEEAKQLNRFYILDKNNEVKIKPVLYIDKLDECNLKNSQDSVEAMYIWDDKNGFVTTTPNQIKSKLENKQLYYSYYSEDDIFSRSMLEREIEDETEHNMKYSALNNEKSEEQDSTKFI